MTFTCAACWREFEIDGEGPPDPMPEECSAVCDDCFKVLMSGQPTEHEVPGVALSFPAWFAVKAKKISEKIFALGLGHDFAIANSPRYKPEPITLDLLQKTLDLLPPIPVPEFPNPCDVGPVTYQMIRRIMAPVPLDPDDIAEVEAMTRKPSPFDLLMPPGGFGGIVIHQRTDVAEGLFHPCRCDRAKLGPYLHVEPESK